MTTTFERLVQPQRLDCLFIDCSRHLQAVIALEMALVGIGLGLTFSPISAAVINSADENRRGVASALVIILRLIGMTVAISSLTAVALQRVNVLAAA